MALDPVVNFFRSTIATLPVASGGTSIILQTGDGAKLPDPAVYGAFNLTIYNADDQFASPEIVRVTAISGDTLTVTRAQEGTSATNKTTGATWNVELTPTAKTIQDIDAKKLDIAGGTMTGDLTIPDKIIHAGDTNTAIRFPANDTVSVETGGVEALRVDSSQRVGISNTLPDALLHIGGSIPISADALNVRGNTDSVYAVSFEQDNIGGYGLLIDTDATLVSQPALNVENSSGSIFYVGSNGNVGIGTTTPATKLDVSGAIRASTGILFGTDTAAANTLDDYEEGTWTPVISDGTNNATNSISNARFTKIGRMVFCQGRCYLSSLGSVNGSLRLTGLPFTISNDPSNHNTSGGLITVMSNGNISAGNNITLLAIRNTNYMSLFKWSSTTGTANVTQADFTAITDIYFTLTYYT